MARQYPAEFELNFKFASYAGLWGNVRYGGLVLSSSLSMVLYQLAVLHSITEREDKVRNILFVLLTMLALIKVATLLWKRKEIAALQDSLRRYMDLSHLSLRDERVLQSKAKSLTHLSNTIYSYFAFALIFCFVVLPLVRRDGWLPLVVSLPVDEDHPYFKHLATATQIIFCSYMATVLSVTEAIFCGFLLQLSAHYEILARRMEEVTSEQDVKLNAEHHLAIIRHVKLVDEVYKESFIFIVLCLTLGLSVCGYQLTTEEITKNTLTTSLILLLLLGDLLLHCVLATNLQVESLDVSRATYSAVWYEQSPSLRRYMTTILLGAQHPPNLTVGGLCPLTTNLFFMVIKTTYNALTVMRQMHQATIGSAK